MAEARRRAEHRGGDRRNDSEPAQQRGTSVEADERIVRSHLKSSRQRGRVESRQRVRIGRIRRVGTRRESARSKEPKPCHREPFRARERRPRGRVDIAPLAAGAGIEQDARDREIDPCACPFGAVGGQAGGNLRPAIDAARLEMAPPAVVRNIEAGIALADGIGHVSRGRLDPIRSPREMSRLSALGRRHDRSRARAYGIRSEQLRRRVRVRHRRVPHCRRLFTDVHRSGQRPRGRGNQTEGHGAPLGGQRTT